MTLKDHSSSTLANLMTFILWYCRVTPCMYYQSFLITHSIERCIYNAACTGRMKYVVKCPIWTLNWIKLTVEILWTVTAAEKLDLYFIHWQSGWKKFMRHMKKMYISFFFFFCHFNSFYSSSLSVEKISNRQTFNLVNF